MALTKERRTSVTETIKTCLRYKFQEYKPETDNMPFHYRLLGKDRMALFSFLQSLNTTFGTSIYEPVAKELAKPIFKEASTQYKLGNIITQDAQNEIQKIMNNLSVGGEVNKITEIEKLRKVARSGRENKLKSVKVAEEFWDFVGGRGAYADLLNCFEQAGIELRPEIDKYFAKFRNKN